VGKRVLIVDDSPTMLTQMRHALEAAGFHGSDIVDAGGGGEAKTLLSDQGPFHLVLCDWNMPGINGLDLLRWLRTEQSDKTTSFYIVTGETSDQQLASLLGAGADGYLCKPVDPRDIVELLET
jgi:two-component system chemotaxis response regulator CheY